MRELAGSYEEDEPISFLTFFGPETPIFEPPGRVYARIDRVEPAGESKRLVLLDSLDADWFDTEGRGFASLTGAEAAEVVDRRVSVIEARVGHEGIGIGLVVAILRDLGQIPTNDFGLCSGLGQENLPALTPWLADLLDDLAGRSPSGPPVTFGDLAAGGVRLELMTTNLTQRRPHRIPWARPETFFYDPQVFRTFFPERVAQHLDDHPPPPPEDERETREWRLLCNLLEPLRPLPPPADLPIVVAARLSLSFPVLLSALPLWAIDWSRKHNQDAMAAWRRWLREHPDQPTPGEDAPLEHPQAEICWFSDGGISSNFPIHFFDAPLPLRPTFAINLRDFHPDHLQSSDETKNVYLPEGSGGGLLEWWYAYPDTNGFARLRAFVESIVRTMQNRVDEAQMRVSGYRDRVVHVIPRPAKAA